MDDAENNIWYLKYRAVFYGAAIALFLFWGWNAWPDIQIDFGRELYIPWQLTQGSVLYRDIASFFGPLSPYWNAFWFLLLGVSVRTLLIVNFLLLILLVVLIERWLRAISSLYAAAVATFFFLIVFAFGRYVMMGNFNYLAPYAHEITHGVVLIFTIVECLRRWSKTNRVFWLGASGLFLGLSFLTKPEIFVAAFSASVTYISILFAVKLKNSDFWKCAAVFAIGAAVPVFAAVSLLSLAMPVKTALANVFGFLMMMNDGRMTQLNNHPYYQWIFGRDSISLNKNIFRLVASGLGYFSVILAGWWLVRVLRNYRRLRLWTQFLITGGVVFFGSFLIPALFPDFSPYLFFMWRFLPVVTVLGIFWSLWRLLKNKAGNRVGECDVLRLASFVFAGALLMKIALNTRIAGYGFVLAMPAALLLVVSFIEYLPQIFKSEERWIFRSFAAGVLIVVSLSHTNLSRNMYALQTTNVGQGADIIRTDKPRGIRMLLILEQLKQRLGHGQTFMVLPEGVTLNYFLRRSIPTLYMNFIPPEMIIFGEDKITGALENHPPDFVVIFPKGDQATYGTFGKDYGIEISDWVKQNYKVAWRFGQADNQLFDPEIHDSDRVFIAERVR